MGRMKFPPKTGHCLFFIVTGSIVWFLICFCFWFFVAVLSKLVTSLKEADSLSSEQELHFLQNLLESKEINALVNVHSKVGKVCKDEKCAPLMSSSIQVNPSHI